MLLSVPHLMLCYFLIGPRPHCRDITINNNMSSDKTTGFYFLYINCLFACLYKELHLIQFLFHGKQRKKQGRGGGWWKWTKRKRRTTNGMIDQRREFLSIVIPNDCSSSFAIISLRVLLSRDTSTISFVHMPCLKCGVERIIRTMNLLNRISLILSPWWDGDYFVHQWKFVKQYLQKHATNKIGFHIPVSVSLSVCGCLFL